MSQQQQQQEIVVSEAAREAAREVIIESEGIDFFSTYDEEFQATIANHVQLAINSALAEKDKEIEQLKEQMISIEADNARLRKDQLG